MSRLVAIALLLGSLGCTTQDSAAKKRELAKFAPKHLAMNLNRFGPKSRIFKTVIAELNKTREPKKVRAILDHANAVSFGTLGSPELIEKQVMQEVKVADEVFSADELRRFNRSYRSAKAKNYFRVFNKAYSRYLVDSIEAYPDKKEQRDIRRLFKHAITAESKTYFETFGKRIPVQFLKRYGQFLDQSQAHGLKSLKSSKRLSKRELARRAKAAGVPGPKR